MARSLAFAFSALSLIVLVIYGQGCGSFGASQTIASSETKSGNSLVGCKPGAGASGSPQTIEEAVTLINSLPKPVTVPCFLESLDRPLKAYATVSTTSAQPSPNGTKSPRIFIFSGPLIMSVVIDGPAKDFLEFGQLKSSKTSLKAEVQFPIASDIAKDLPFERVKFNTGTSCGFCHQQEARDFGITYANAFTSAAIKPDPFSRVNLSYLQNELATCDPAKEANRCQMLKSLLGFGATVEQDFPADMPTL